MSVVIPVRNDAGNLARCLKAIQEQSGAASIEIIVVDNGSIDASRQVAAALGATVLEIPNVFVSTLRNEGLRRALGPLIAFIDADNEIAAGWLAAALPHFVNEQVAAVGCDYSSPAQGTWVQRRYDGFRNHPRTVEPVRWLASGNIVVRRNAALEINGFDTTLETSEDVDFCTRLRLRGYTILADPRMQSSHHGDPRTLRDLFRSELWRGRDTLRVGLRGVNSWLELPSIVFPIITLTAILVGFGCAFLAAPVGAHLLWWTAGSIMVVLALSLLRAGRMLMRVADRCLAIVPAVLVVAVVYDLARAFALVYRMPHRGTTPQGTHREIAA